MLLERNVKSEDIFMDHAGFSTYDSMYRAKDILRQKKIVIVTQKYHMYRAIYVAESIRLRSICVNSDPQTYAGQTMRELKRRSS